MKHVVRELTERNRADAEFVIRARFPESALMVLDKIMCNPHRDEHVGFGDILYVDGRPVAFRAALRRNIYVGKVRALARVRGLTCRLIDSPLDSISRLIEAQKANPRGCIMAISNTQCVPTEKRALQNGATLGPETCRRFIWRAIRPWKCMSYFLRRKILRTPSVVFNPFNTLQSCDYSISIDSLKVKRLTLRDLHFFDELMGKYLDTNVGIVSSRTSKEMEWIYKEGIQAGTVVVLGASDGKGPVGYLLLKSNCSCVRWLLGDMLAVGNNIAILRVLLEVACRFLREKTPAMMLESIGFPVYVEPLLKKYMPHERKCEANYDSFNFFSDSDTLKYKDIMLSNRSWFFSPYDGDMCLDV